MSDSRIAFTPTEVSAYYAARLPSLKRQGTTQWRGPCPLHLGEKDSFAVDGSTGRWFCHSKCQFGGDILDFEKALSGEEFQSAKAAVYELLGRTESERRHHVAALARANAAKSIPNGRAAREIERYAYVDENSCLLFEVVRFEAHDGSKAFLQCRRDASGQEVWNLKGVKRVPYRLPKLLQAETVYLVEGERDVCSLEEWALVASCNPGGSGGSRLYEGWLEYFRGRHIVILPDNDPPGRKHALAVATALLNVAASVRLVELPGLMENGDVTDWKAAGGTIQQFLQLVGAAASIDAASIAKLRVRWKFIGSRLKVDAPYDWPQPQPIQSELPPVQAFSEEFLPESFRPLVRDVGERMQVPIDYPATIVTLCLAGAVNRRAIIRPKANDTGWEIVPNLWGGIIAPPGFLKSPVIQAVTRPLNQIQNEWRIEYEESLKNHELEKEKFGLRLAAWKEQYKSNTKKENSTAPLRPEDEPQGPSLRRLIANDATFEALHEMMKENSAGLLVIRDELPGWWSQLDRAGREGERAFCLQAWNGDTAHTIDRIGRGTIHVPACCVSMLGGIQPGKLRSYMVDALKDGPTNDGLIQRFQLLVWPDTTSAWKYIDRAPDAKAEQELARIFRKLLELDADDPISFRFTSDAQELFEKWLGELEAKVRGDELHPALISHLSKYRSLMPSLALLFSLVDWAAGSGAELVSSAHARQAIGFCSYLESHAQRVYSCIATPQMRAANELADKIKRRKVGTEGVFSARQVYLKGWSGLDTPDAVKQAAEILADAGWVRETPDESGPSGGRPSLRYQINPGIGE